MAGLGFKRDKTQVLSGDWSDQFFSKGFQIILLGTFPRPATVERGGLLCTSCTMASLRSPLSLCELLFLVLPSPSGSSSVMALLGLATGCCSLGMQMLLCPSLVEGSPLRTELIFERRQAVHAPLTFPVSSHYFNTTLVKKIVLGDLSQKHFLLLLLPLMQLIHTLFSITQMPGHPWRVPCPDISRPVSPFLSPPSVSRIYSC